jgi:hypothetical protein
MTAGSFRTSEQQRASNTACAASDTVSYVSPTSSTSAKISLEPCVFKHNQLVQRCHLVGLAKIMLNIPQPSRPAKLFSACLIVLKKPWQPSPGRRPTASSSSWHPLPASLSPPLCSHCKQDTQDYIFNTPRAHCSTLSACLWPTAVRFQYASGTTPYAFSMRQANSNTLAAYLGHKQYAFSMPRATCLCENSPGLASCSEQQREKPGCTDVH